MLENNKTNILIVDDDPGLRNAIVFDFKRKGFNVFDAENGTLAFKIVQTNKIDVVLTDVRMPNGDGIELLEKIKALNPNLPVVMFITGFADISLEEAYDKGVDAVFSKPFDRKTLFAAVNRAILDITQNLSSRKRVRTDGDFEVVLNFPDINFAVRGRVLNLGRGGIFIALDGDLPTVGAKTNFIIKFQNGLPESIEGNGIVRWIRALKTDDRLPGCGIEFEYLSDQCRQQIVELINELKTKSFIPRK